MSLNEPGLPYFFKFGSDPRQDMLFPGARQTSAGLYRVFDITKTSPHEPWCIHFEWGPCNCGPRPGEVFIDEPTNLTKRSKIKRAWQWITRR